MKKLFFLSLLSMNAMASSQFPVPCTVLETVKFPNGYAAIGMETVKESECAPGESYGVVAFAIDNEGKVVNSILKTEHQRACLVSRRGAEMLLQSYRDLKVCL